ncbi:MAG: PAS domain S-box protein [Proteobacteria bacterium]|nr:PAS domain S-box protein [Pseudomonadota bacterium]
MSCKPIDQKLYADQVDQLYAGLKASMLANLLNSLILAVVLLDVSSPFSLLLWVAAVVAISLARCVLYKIYQRSAQDRVIQAPKWGVLFNAGLMISGIVWGFAGMYFFPPHSTPHQIFIAFVLGGMVAGASASTSAVKNVYFLYLFPVILPLTCKFFLVGDEIHTAMGIMLLVYILGCVLLYREVFRIIRNSLLVGYENEKEIRERRKAESELKKHQEKLESIVEVRTLELKNKNTQLNEEIAERRKAEKQLRLEMDKLEIVTENIGVGLCIISRDYRILWANKILTAMFGNVTGGCCYKTFNGQEDVCSFCGVKEIFGTGVEVVRTEAVGRDKDGNPVHSEIIATPLYDDQGNITSALEVVLPVTESRRREKILSELLGLSKILSSTTDLQTIYRQVISLAQGLLRFDFSTVLILTQEKNALVPTDTIGFSQSAIGTVLELRELGLATYVVQEKKPGAVVDFKTEKRFAVPSFIKKYTISSALSVPMMIGDEVFGVLIGHTLQQRKFTDAEVSLYQTMANQAAVAIKNAMHLHSLAASERKFRSLFDSTHDAIMIYDLEGGLIGVNKVTCDRLGYSRAELLQMKPGQFVAPQYAALVPERMQKLKEVEKAIFETAHVSKDGSVVPIELSLQRIEYENRPALLGVARDISQRKKREEERLRTQKLESVGVLAGGIAHDFNNLLTGILGNISLAKLSAEADGAIQKSLVDTEKAALRARDLTQQLLTFSKGGAPLKSPSSIVDIIRDSSSFAIRGSRSVCAYDFAENLWFINADRGQMAQVFQNLVINASQSMPAGGVIEIRGGNVELQKGDVPQLAAGKYVEIAVQDHGTGIAKMHKEKIFDPYFSTKQTGSGLGLAVVYSIVKNHDGHISLQSETGQGTTFTLFLPAILPEKQEEEPVDDKVFAGRGKVLFMDDEELIRDVAAQILLKLGFEPHLAGDGSEALDLYIKAWKEGEPFAVVIMDLTIPGGMGGREAMEKLLAIDPAVKAIVSSGYANDPIMANYAQFGFKGVVPKPFTVPQLSRVLHQVLGISV